jgi:hypothetical protein
MRNLKEAPWYSILAAERNYADIASDRLCGMALELNKQDDFQNVQAAVNAMQAGFDLRHSSSMQSQYPDPQGETSG